jgi:uracil-DNA glycosylase
MDSFLRRTIERMSPKYVLLCGRFAQELFEDIFVDQSDVAVKDMESVGLHDITLVPLLHLSRRSFMESNVEKLKPIGKALGWQDL